MAERGPDVWEKENGSHSRRNPDGSGGGCSARETFHTFVDSCVGKPRPFLTGSGTSFSHSGTRIPVVVVVSGTGRQDQESGVVVVVFGFGKRIVVTGRNLSPGYLTSTLAGYLPDSLPRSLPEPSPKSAGGNRQSATACPFPLILRSCCHDALSESIGRPFLHVTN